jgi:cytidylate kinase
MSGGNDLAMCLAGSLGWPSLSREVLVEAAAKLGVPEEVLRAKVLKEVGLWERISNDRRLYVIALQAALAEQCLSCDLVYHGHAGHLLLKGLPNVLRVRLIAPMETRIQRLQKRDNISHEAALNYINKQDKDRVQWCRYVYDVDWGDPLLYDMVLNLEHITIPVACWMIAAAVKLPEMETTDEVREKVASFALACRVKLALALNHPTRNMVFRVRAELGRVEIFTEDASAGILVRSTGPGREEIASIARTVEGVKEVSVSMHRFPECPDF